MTEHHAANILPSVEISPDDPIPLSEAVRIFFPAGGVTVRSLRTEVDKGRLVVERIAGKDYVTKQEVDKMRSLCRVQKSPPDSGSEEKETNENDGSSSTEEGKNAQDALKAKLKARKKPSPVTLPGSTNQTLAKVIPIRSS